MISGFGLGTTARRVASIPVYSGIPMGIIRWDAFSNDASLNWYTSAGFNKYYGSTAKFNCRRASQWANSQQWGTGVDTQAIMNAELAFCKNKIDYWMYDWYPPASIIPGIQQSNIMRMFDAHANSALKNNVKFCFLLQGDWFSYPSFTWANEVAFANWILPYTQDSNYFTIDGKPVFSVYNDTNGASLVWTSTHWNTFKGIIGPVYGIAVNSLTLRTNLGLQANMRYGPNGNLPAGTGEQSAQTQMTTDVSHWGSSPGADPISSVTFYQDRRPFIPATVYADKHSQPQLVSHLAAAIVAPSSKTMIGYAHSEETEGGPGCALTFQEGSRAYDACYWVRGGPKPSIYEYPLSFHSAGTSGSNKVIQSGSWTYQFPDPSGVQGAHDNDEMWSSNAGDSLEITHDALVGYDIVGSKAPGLGTMTLQEDDITVATISFNGTSAVAQNIITRSFSNNPPVSHKVKIIVDGTGQVRPDFIRLRYKP